MNKILTIGCLFYVALYAFVWFLVAKMFEYSLFVCFGTDAPWYADLLGGLVLNVLNFPIFVLCWIINISGGNTPLFQ